MRHAKTCGVVVALSLAGCASGYRMAPYERAALPGCEIHGPTTRAACEACGGADAGACMRVSEAYARGEEARYDEGMAALFAGRACELGDARGCHLAGVAYRDGTLRAAAGTGPAGLISRACEAATSGCAAGDLALCHLEVMCTAERTRTKPSVQALATLCERGHGPSCAEASWCAGEPEVSAKLARRGCEARDSESCNVYASDQLVGYGVPVDEAAGKALFERVCSGTGNVFACAGAQGFVSPRVLERARLGEPAPSRPQPDLRTLGSLSPPLAAADRSAILGFCLDDGGAAGEVKVLQSWGDPRMDTQLELTLRGWNYGPQRLPQRCWWATFRMRLMYK